MRERERSPPTGGVCEPTSCRIAAAESSREGQRKRTVIDVFGRI